MTERSWGVDDNGLEAMADRLVDSRGVVGAETEEEGDVQADDEPLRRRHRRRLLYLPRLDTELDHARAGHQDVHSGREGAIGHGAEEVLHADVAGGDRRARTPLRRQLLR